MINLMAMKSVEGKAVGRAVTFAFPLIAGAALGMSLVYLTVRPLWSDQTWLLFAARRLLDGARLGSDLIETNPPLIIWMSEIPVAIGRALDIHLPTALQGCLVVLVVFSVTWSAVLLQRGAAGESRSSICCSGLW